MDRKDFLKSCAMLGVSSCFLPSAIDAAARSIQNGAPVTPCDEKEMFSQKCVKRFFDGFDKNLDEKKKTEIMESCWKMCFQGSLGKERPCPIDVDQLIERINKATGEIAAKRDGNIVDFHYMANPRGLRASDGYCLCPLVESRPEGLSGRYCDCSVRYVKEMFRTYTGRDANVDLMESLKRGGRTCRIKITLAS